MVAWVGSIGWLGVAIKLEFLHFNKRPQSSVGRYRIPPSIFFSGLVLGTHTAVLWTVEHPLTTGLLWGSTRNLSLLFIKYHDELLNQQDSVEFVAGSWFLSTLHGGNDAPKNDKCESIRSYE